MSVHVRINCVYNDQGAWCTNKLIKRSLCGLGARCCIEFDERSAVCKYKVIYPKPDIQLGPMRSNRVVS